MIEVMFTVLVWYVFFSNFMHISCTNVGIICISIVN